MCGRHSFQRGKLVHCQGVLGAGRVYRRGQLPLHGRSKGRRVHKRWEGLSRAAGEVRRREDAAVHSAPGRAHVFSSARALRPATTAGRAAWSRATASFPSAPRSTATRCAAPPTRRCCSQKGSTPSCRAQFGQSSPPSSCLSLIPPTRLCGTAPFTLSLLRAHGRAALLLPAGRKTNSTGRKTAESGGEGGSCGPLHAVPRPGTRRYFPVPQISAVRRVCVLKRQPALLSRPLGDDAPCLPVPSLCGHQRCPGSVAECVRCTASGLSNPPPCVYTELAVCVFIWVAGLKE